MNTLYILLPVHNRIESTRRLIDCLEQQTFRAYHLVLIDDGSIDGTSEMIQERISALTILRGDGGWWWGGSLHQGYRWLQSQSVSPSAVALILNDDSVFDPEYLQTALSILNQRERTLLVSTAYGEKSRELIDGGIHADWIRWKFRIEKNPSAINCASTRGLFLRVSDFMDIGGFHPWLLPHYGSDYEFTIRAVRKGYILLVDERLKLWTNERTTGYHNLKREVVYSHYLKSLFSKKSTLNPFYLTNFIALACPWPWKIFNWLRIWLSTVWKLVKNFFVLVVVSGRRNTDANMTT